MLCLVPSGCWGINPWWMGREDFWGNTLPEEALSPMNPGAEEIEPGKPSPDISIFLLKVLFMYHDIRLKSKYIHEEIMTT
jgi:hypothetical protein